MSMKKADYQAGAHNILTTIGYLFVSITFIILIGANWDEIPRALRMWGVILNTVATQGFALSRAYIR